MLIKYLDSKVAFCFFKDMYVGHLQNQILNLQYLMKCTMNVQIITD